MLRRDFLRIVGAAATGALVAPATVLGSTDWVDRWWMDEDRGAEDPPGAVKPEGPQVQAGKFCDGRFCLKSAIHGEASEFHFRDTAGNYNHEVLQRLNWFLRCRDGSWQYMDIRMLETLNYLSALMDVPQIQVNSGYRSPAYNARLAITNENVARNSLHQFGQAIDFSILGVSVKNLCSYALYARNTVGYGGVGYYPRAGFVHLDSGRTKQWVR